MLILEDSSRIIASSLAAAPTEAPLDISFCDFGATRYRLQTVGGGEGTAGVFRLSVSLPGYAELHKLGLHEHLKEQLGPAAALVAAEAGFDLAVEVARDGLSDALIEKLAQLRRLSLGLPLSLAIAAQEAGASSPLVRVPLREADAMFIQAQADRVTVVLATRFDDPSDVVLGRVFLQEFFDARRQANLQNAPAVLFGKEPPTELQSQIAPHPRVNYVTFVLFPVHYREKKREKTISLVLSFRDYFHYHIKCAKAYLHNRMRAKAADFLKTLNRTKALAAAPSRAPPCA